MPDAAPCRLTYVCASATLNAGPRPASTRSSGTFVLVREDLSTRGCSMACPSELRCAGAADANDRAIVGRDHRAIELIALANVDIAIIRNFAPSLTTASRSEADERTFSAALQSFRLLR